MKKMLLLLLISTLALSGCDFLRNKKYSGKVFNIRVEYWEGRSARVEIWKNANNVSYDSEENTYTFYVDGKVVVLDNIAPVVLTETGSVPPISGEDELYLGKKFDLSVTNGENVVKIWKNIEIKSTHSERIQLLSGHQAVTVIPSTNDTIIIEEVK